MLQGRRSDAHSLSHDLGHYLCASVRFLSADLKSLSIPSPLYESQLLNSSISYCFLSRSLWKQFYPARKECVYVCVRERESETLYQHMSSLTSHVLLVSLCKSIKVKRDDPPKDVFILLTDNILVFWYTLPLLSVIKILQQVAYNKVVHAISINNKLENSMLWNYCEPTAQHTH